MKALFAENDIIVHRINTAHVTQGLLIQAAIGSVMSEKGVEAFNALINSLRGEPATTGSQPEESDPLKPRVRGPKDSRVPARSSRKRHTPKTPKPGKTD